MYENFQSRHAGETLCVETRLLWRLYNVESDGRMVMNE